MDSHNTAGECCMVPYTTLQISNTELSNFAKFYYGLESCVMYYNIISGDHTLVTPVMHGNARSPLAMPRNPILPSVARAVEANGDKPSATYENMKMSATNPQDQKFKVPSSKGQIKNLRKNFRRHTGQADITSILVRLSKEYRTFHLFVLAPRTTLVLGEPLMIEYVRKVLKRVSWTAG